jgi:hypothetical protein
VLIKNGSGSPATARPHPGPFAAAAAR